VDFGDEDLGGFSEFFRTVFGGAGGGFGGGRSAGGATGGGGFEDLFGRARQPRGADVEGSVDLTLDEVLRGTTRTVNLEGEGGATARKIEVRIPAGVADGTRVRAAGEGAGSSGARGDLYLRVRVLPHPQFERAGSDLKTAVTVPLTTAVLGGEAMVPTLDGPVGIKVPAGSRPGRTFRLRGHGLPRLEAGGGKGDLLASLGVELPAKLTDRERDLFEELKRLGH
jgi:DnaJ-class molecular chaperone